jgi:hypothetical protein
MTDIQEKPEKSVRTTGKTAPKEPPTPPAAWPEMADSIPGVMNTSPTGRSFKNNRRTEPKTLTTTETQQSPATPPNNEHHQGGINGGDSVELADERRPRQRHRFRGLRVGCQRSRSRPYAIWAPAIDHGQCTKRYGGNGTPPSGKHRLQPPSRPTHGWTPGPHRPKSGQIRSRPRVPPAKQKASADQDAH